MREDPEWARFSQVPGLTDPWNDVRDKFNVATGEELGDIPWNE